MNGNALLVAKNQFGEQQVLNVLPGSSGQIDVNFVVDSTNGNGLGIRSLKGPGYSTAAGVPGVSNVFMHTSTTPAGGNPNPAAGLIVVQFAKNYSAYIGGYSGAVSPLTGSALTLSAGGGAIVAGNAYVIVSLGTTTTAANFVTAGLPVGNVAAVGAAFIATAAAATGTGLGNAQVQAVGVSGVMSFEIMGDANQTLNGTSGSQLILQCLAPTVSGSAYQTPMLPTAPANGSVIGLRFVMAFAAA